MATRANNAALNAAMVAGGYNSINNMVSNYRIPANYKRTVQQMRNTKRSANSTYSTKNEANKALANIKFDQEIIKNLISMGIKSAKPTKKERKNAEAERARRAKAASVITKRFIKSKAPGAKKARERRVKEAAANYRRRLNQEKMAATATERARAAAQRLRNERSRTGTATVTRQGLTQRVEVSGGQHTHRNAAPRAQAPAPSGTLFRRAPNAGPLLSPSASAVSRRTVNEIVEAPSAGRGRAAPNPRASLESTLRRLGRGRGR